MLLHNSDCRLGCLSDPQRSLPLILIACVAHSACVLPPFPFLVHCTLPLRSKIVQPLHWRKLPRYYIVVPALAYTTRNELSLYYTKRSP